MLIRWPGVIEPGTVNNEMCAHEDLLPTFLAAAGDPDIVEKCLEGHTVGDKTYKVHLDGYNLMPAFKEPPDEWPRKLFVYWGDDGEFLALRYEHWKVVFQEQRAHGLAVWEEPFVELRAPHMFNIRSDPFERGPEGIYYGAFKAEHLFIVVPAAALAAEWLQTFREFPPRMKPGSFSLDRVMEQVQRNRGRTDMRGAGLDSWNDTPTRAAIGPSSSRSRPTAATSCRPRNGSPSSTTTGRSGPRSRCRSSSTSPSTEWRRWRRPTHHFRTSSRGRRRTRRT